MSGSVNQLHVTPRPAHAQVTTLCQSSLGDPTSPEVTHATGDHRRRALTLLTQNYIGRSRRPFTERTDNVKHLNKLNTNYNNITFGSYEIPPYCYTHEELWDGRLAQRPAAGGATNP